MAQFISSFFSLALARTALSRAQRCHRLGHAGADAGLGDMGFFAERDGLAALSRALFREAGEDRLLVFSNE
jgi:hypothetical protein